MMLDGQSSGKGGTMMVCDLHDRVDRVGVRRSGTCQLAGKASKPYLGTLKQERVRPLISFASRLKSSICAFVV